MITITDEMAKDVYAHFGRTYYASECLHRQLCVMYVISTFYSPKEATRPRIEEKLTYAYSLTLGKIIEETQSLVSEHLKSLLDQAIEKRNFLAHYFWWERIHLFCSPEGIKEMISELLEYESLFNYLDEQLVILSSPILECFGLTDETTQEHLNNLLAGKPRKPLKKQRKLNKSERFIKAYNRKSLDGITLILESHDGLFWQLCDIGLGWCAWEQPEESWVINEKNTKIFTS